MLFGTPAAQNHAHRVVFGIPGAQHHANNMVFGIPAAQNHVNRVVFGIPGAQNHADSMVFAVGAKAADVDGLLIGLFPPSGLVHFWVGRTAVIEGKEGERTTKDWTGRRSSMTGHIHISFLYIHTYIPLALAPKTEVVLRAR